MFVISGFQSKIQGRFRESVSMIEGQGLSLKLYPVRACGEKRHIYKCMETYSS